MQKGILDILKRVIEILSFNKRFWQNYQKNINSHDENRRSNEKHIR